MMKIKALSATAIRDFLQCPLKIVYRYDREIPAVKNDHARVGIAVHTALEQFTRRMLTKKSFPDPSDYEFAITAFMNSATEEGLEKMSFYTEGRTMVTDFVDKFDPAEEVLDLEYRFKLETPEGVPITGACDKVVKVNDATLAVVDFKTSRTVLTASDLRDDIQLSMYDLAASIAWPEYENRILYLDYVRLGKCIPTYRTDEQRAAFRDFLCSIWLQISKMDEREVTGRLNRLCGWCDYRDVCPAYGKFVKGKKLELEPLTDMEDADFIDHWEDVSNKKAILVSREKELKMIATERFMSGEAIQAEGKELYSTQQSRTGYDVEQVRRLLPEEDLFSVVAINNGRLNRYAKDDPDLRRRLSQIANVSYNAPIFKTRAVTEEEEIDEPTDADEETD